MWRFKSKLIKLKYIVKTYLSALLTVKYGANNKTKIEIIIEPLNHYHWISNYNNQAHTKGKGDSNSKSNSSDDNNDNKNKNNSQSGRKNNKQTKK